MKVKRFILYGIPKSFLLKILIALAIILIGQNVFAAEINVSSKIRYSTDYAGGTYNGDEIALGGYSGPYSVGTRYNGRLSMLSFYLSSNDYDFVINHTYTITLNMATQDWRNHFMGPQVLKVNSDGSFISSNGALSVSNFRFVSYKQIKFNFTTNNSISPYYFFRLYSSDYASNNTIAITGDNNWALSSVIINDQVSSSGSGSSGSSGSGSNINNNTLSCTNGLTILSTTYNDSNVNITGSYINSSGNLVANVGYNVINYIPIKPNTNYQIKKTTSTGDVPSYCLSTSTNSYGSCTAYNTNNTFTFNSGSNTYLSLSIKPDETIYLSYCASSIEIDNQNTQNIIDNQNQNTTDIIDNQNKNTQDIIDNQNQNTQDLINSNKVCKNYLINKDSVVSSGFLKSDGSIQSSSSGIGITDYYQLTSSSTLSLKKTTTNAGAYFCFYNNNKEVISCIQNVGLSTGNITIPSGSSYVRFSINANTTGNYADRPNFELYTCVDGNQAISDSLSDSNVDNGTGSDFFNDFQTQDNGGISGIITKPLVLINSLLSSNNSCNNLPLSISFPGSETKNVSFPSGCILWDNVPQSVVNIYHIFIVGFCSYYLLKRLFKDVEDLKNPEKDNVEVIDL